MSAPFRSGPSDVVRCRLHGCPLSVLGDLHQAAQSPGNIDTRSGVAELTRQHFVADTQIAQRNGWMSGSHTKSACINTFGKPVFDRRRGSVGRVRYSERWYLPLGDGGKESHPAERVCISLGLQNVLHTNRNSAMSLPTFDHSLRYHRPESQSPRQFLPALEAAY